MALVIFRGRIEDHGVMPLCAIAVGIAVWLQVVIVRSEVHEEAFITDIDNKGSHIVMSVVGVVLRKVDGGVERAA